MSPRVFIPASQISTRFRCDDCRASIRKVNWKQCKVCKGFNLCDDCAREYHEYDKLLSNTRRNHEKLHLNTPVTNDCMELISVVEAETGLGQVEEKNRGKVVQRILNKKEIRNDYEMPIVIDKLKEISVGLTSPSKEDQLKSILNEYHSKANQRNIRVISLDARGVRGYMPIKILGELISQKYLPNIGTLYPKNSEHKELFRDAQKKFTKDFDYFAGTNAGGLIGFCLAVNYNIMDIQEIFSNSTRYFRRNYLGPLIYSKYDPSIIHGKIDDIINSITFPGDKKISAEHATLLDIRNLLNPDNIIDEEKEKLAFFEYGNSLEFVDEDNFQGTSDDTDKSNKFHPVKREKVLLITAYNTTRHEMTIFNTSYSKHWGYRIADVLKSTMAVPTYFPQQQVYKGKKMNGYFIPGPTSELFIDGGAYANDPESAALWVIRMQWRKPVKYHILSIGTAISYLASSSPSTWGCYFGWIFNKESLIDTLMYTSDDFTKIIGGTLIKSDNMQRMKLNYKLTKSMKLDDAAFVKLFDKEWQYLKNEEEFRAFIYFYDKYCIANNLFPKT